MSDELPDLTSHAVLSLDSELVEIRLTIWHFCAALVFLFVSMLGAILTDLQLVGWNPASGIELFSPGRWLMIQSDALAYGFLANAFFACLHWIVPQLARRPVLSRPLSYFVFFMWQAVVLATVAGILAGYAQGVEWAETPVFVDPLALAGLLLGSLNFIAPILRSRQSPPESLWYFLAALVWIPLVYAMGNFVPQYFVSGVTAGIVSGLFIQDTMGLFFAALGWGTIYYFVPVLLGKPIWSRRLSRIGFWGLALFCPLSGVRHFLFSPIPMGLQIFAVVATVAFELSILVAIVNCFGTARGRFQRGWSNLPLRWIYTGMFFYLVACLQGALQAMFPVQAIVQFTDWNVGHFDLLLFGVFTCWLMGAVTYLFPLLWGRPWHSQTLCQWHYWLSTVGIVLVVCNSMIAGVLQGNWWASLAPWTTSLDGSRPFWIFRVFAVLIVFAGQLCFFYNFCRTWSRSVASSEPTESAIAVASSTVCLFESKTVVLWGGGFGCFMLAFIAIVLLPIFMFENLPTRTIKELPNPNLMYEVEDLAHRYPEPFKKYFGEPTREAAAAALRLGRDVYVGEGCWRCHSQFVRPVSNESRRWGPVAEAWEYQNELQRPVMFGTRRVGPDLSREGGRHSNDWHAAHLFQPTLTFIGSPMPEYPWFFDGTPNKPNRRGLAVIAYIQWLGSWLGVYPYYEDYQSIEHMERAMLEAGAEK